MSCIQNRTMAGNFWKRLSTNWKFTALMVVALSTTRTEGGQSNQLCKSPQFLELGKLGIIGCSFHEGYFGVFWYNTTNYREDLPIVTYKQSSKGGVGFLSGEFDVFENGSLVIKEVSIKHETSFTISYLASREEFTETSIIDVFVIAKPSPPFPVIDNCGKDSKFCFVSLELPFDLKCYTEKTRPSVDLHWLQRSEERDIPISYNVNTSSEEALFTSRVTSEINLPLESALTLFVCKATNATSLLTTDESLILVQSKQYDMSHLPEVTKYFEFNKSMELPCTDKKITSLLWKRGKDSQSINEDLSFASFVDVHSVGQLSPGYRLDDFGVLTVSQTRLQHEGSYICLFSSQEAEGMSAYRAFVYVNPVPPYLIVEGCPHSENCVLEVSRKDNLTCSLRGIRPKVKLELQVLSASPSATFSFLKNDMTTTNNDFTFDLSLVSHFHLSGVLGSVVELQCKVIESDTNLFNISRNIKVRFIRDSSVPANATPDTITTTENWYLWFLWLLALPLTVIIVLIYKWKTAKETHTKNSQSNVETSPDELHPMVPVPEITSKDINGEKQTLFVSQLKKNYEVMYESVQPIPYIKDRLYCVEKIFVEGGLQVFDESLKQWKKINSHEDLFEHISKNTTICIIEGEPGYGKSTLTLRLAYDWCNPKKSTFLSNVDLFILLQLRQLTGVESIYWAIRRFLLPSDSSLREGDIKNILDTCKSVVVLLDGYDEYHFESDNVDIMRIINYEMFQDFQVLVTTRSSFLLPKRLPRTAKVNLSGFDREARRSYIQKAVVGDDNKSLVAKVETHLEKNPILNDLCQVPLLFVVFAHMTHEREDFTTMNSVTSFFRYMVSSFHGHMRAKLGAKEAIQYQSLEREHQKLNKVAFEALRRKTKSIVWRKEELINTLGQEHYNMFYRTGILVEEEILDISDNGHFSISEHIQYRTQVRFYHKLFCEWYAAHYICDYVKESPSTIIGEFLRTFDPYDLQYVYRFACGLDSKVAKLIIDYLMTRDDSDKFVILCILEHTGNIDDIKEVIHHLCNEGVIISETDTHLLQRSTIQLLEIASRTEVTIKYVKFHNSINSVDDSSRNIILKSGLSFSKNIRVEAIAIDMDNRDMTAKEVEDLLLFSSSCHDLGLLSLDCCLPPRFIDFTTFESNLIERSFTVEWQLSDSCTTFVLDLQTGRWQNGKTKEELTQEYYKILKVAFSGIDQKRKMNPESDKLKVNMMRATLRNLSES